MPTLATFTQNIIGSPNHSNHSKKKKNGIQTGKEEIKLSLFADDMVLNIENPKDVTKQLLELINKFHNITIYKIKTQYLLHFYIQTNYEK